MLTDPLSITYNSVAKSLARGSGVFPQTKRQLLVTHYRDSADEFFARIVQSTLGNGGVQAQIYLGRTNPDTDPDPMIGARLSNYVGLVFAADPFRANTATDIPLLRSALLSFVDTTMQNRLINGEA